MFSRFLNCLTPSDVSGFSGSEYERRESKEGTMSTRGSRHAQGRVWVLCVRSGGMLGERKSLETLQKQTLQSSMAYPDALTMKLLEIQPTRLLLNVTGLAMLTVCPSPSPPPQSQHSPPCPGLLLCILLNCFSCVSPPEHSIYE